MAHEADIHNWVAWIQEKLHFLIATRQVRRYYPFHAPKDPERDCRGTSGDPRHGHGYSGLVPFVEACCAFLGEALIAQPERKSERQARPGNMQGGREK